MVVESTLKATPRLIANSVAVVANRDVLSGKKLKLTIGMLTIPVCGCGGRVL